MRPVIGVIPLYDENKESIWMVPGYLRVIEEAGGLPVILPYTTDEIEIKEAANLCDGFLFTGGHDVNPTVYGEIKKNTCGVACDTRDIMEKIIFSMALADDKPVFGICRGIQMINALCGGTLYQDLPSEYMCKVEHHMTAPYDRSAHKVTIENNTPLSEWLGITELEVNSYHHQAVKELGKGLVPMAYSEDGLIEAIYMPDKKFIVAVQWHPEFNYKKEESSSIMMKQFVLACTH